MLNESKTSRFERMDYSEYFEHSNPTMNFTAMLLNIYDKLNCSKRRVHIDTSAQTDWHQIAYPIAVTIIMCRSKSCIVCWPLYPFSISASAIHPLQPECNKVNHLTQHSPIYCMQIRSIERLHSSKQWSISHNCIDWIDLFFSFKTTKKNPFGMKYSTVYYFFRRKWRLTFEHFIWWNLTHSNY